MNAKVFIPLTQGQVTVIDFEDYELVKKYKWRAIKAGKYAKTFYVYSSISKKACNNKIKSIHRIITNCPDNMVVDHIDGNGLNNCRSNLRICTVTENGRNKTPKKNSITGYKGVSKKYGRKNTWNTHIIINGKSTYIGCSKTPELAAIKYNNAAIKYFGEFALLNVIKKEVNE